jgi:hypothetical protein
MDLMNLLLNGLVGSIAVWFVISPLGAGKLFLSLIIKE